MRGEKMKICIACRMGNCEMCVCAPNCDCYCQQEAEIAWKNVGYEQPQ